MQVDEPLRSEITPKNILMIGPTGVGKTEISRRLARLAKAPFIKVEATKFTEVGYVGRDVESIVRDLVDVAVKLSRERAQAVCLWCHMEAEVVSEDFKPGDDVLRVYTTRPDTLFGATYMVLSPEHPWVETLTSADQGDVVRAYWIARQPQKYRGILIFLVMIPFWTNFLVRTYAWMLILRDSGLINTVWTGSIHNLALQLGIELAVANDQSDHTSGYLQKGLLGRG